ncbi:MAG: hypothetical protein QOG36_850 [Actinomycetota bacterium]|jgi:hypothetical protein|nr:hypothetical protein [Actinomycetota bacterium]
MAITGAHVLLHSPEAGALRAVLNDVMGWDSVDAGGGWLIFALPPAELAVHPAEQPSHQLTLMCDDIDATVADLRAKGIVFRDEPHEERFGIVTTMVLPGDVDVMLYEPRHPTAV